MTLAIAFSNVGLAADRLGAVPLVWPASDLPFADEVVARATKIEKLERQLVDEWAAFSPFAAQVAAADALPCVEPFAPPEPTSAEPSQAAAPSEVVESGPQESRFADVTDEDVAEGARRLADAGDVAENTRRSYESALRGLDAWLRERRPGQALNDAGMAEYLAVLMAKGRGVASAALAVAAAKRRAKLRGEKSPAAKRTAEALLRYRRAGGAGPGQVRGISWEEADRMRDLAASGSDARGLRDAALIAVTSDALLRVSEAANIAVDDIRFEDDGTARLLLRRSKTDRSRRGEVLFLGSRTAELVREWTAAASIRDGALFRRIWRGGGVGKLGIKSASARRVIVKRAAAASVRGRVSGHSLRVGSAQSLAKRGAGLVAMQRAGRWASPHMPARYTRSQAAAEGAVALLRYHHDAQGTNGGPEKENQKMLDREEKRGLRYV